MAVDRLPLSFCLCSLIPQEASSDAASKRHPLRVLNFLALLPHTMADVDTLILQKQNSFDLLFMSLVFSVLQVFGRQRLVWVFDEQLLKNFIEDGIVGIFLFAR